MIDRLRIFWRQPLTDASRRCLFALAVVVIVAVAALAHFAAAQRSMSDDAPRTRSDSEDSPSASQDIRAFPSPTAAPEVPGEETAVSPSSRSSAAAARHAARQFLAGYLPYTYGRARASNIAAASRELREHLRHQRPRVPQRERRRHPRALLVQTDAVGARDAAAGALVADGARRYRIDLRLHRRGSGWLVSALVG